MRLPDPFTHPNKVPGFSSVVLIDNDPMIREELPSGTVKEVKVASQYWGINIDYPDLFEDEHQILDAFILNYKRTGGSIDILLPQYEKFHVMGDMSICTIPQGLKGSSITINNTSHLIGVPQIGDLFKLTTNKKVYKIVEFEKLDTSWELKLYPDLSIITNGLEKPIFNTILFNTVLTNPDSYAVSLNSDGVYTSFSVSVRESL